MEEIPAQEEVISKNHPRIVNKFENKSGILKAFAIGIVVTGLLVAGKWGLEQTSFGHRLELLAYEFLQKRLSPFDPNNPLPVVVLDISKMKGGKDGTDTSRKQLLELVEALVMTEPRVIAVDVNFSPSRKGDLSGEDDFGFFDNLIKQKKKSNVPIYVGVTSEAVVSGDPELWLGAQEYNELSAFMDINDENTTKLPYSIKCGTAELNSFSGALVQNENEPDTAAAFFKPILKDLKMDEEKCGKNCSCNYLTVNYAKLEVIQAQSLPIITADAIKNAEEKFRDKIVIMGDAALDKSQDTFVVVGRKKPVSGVYLHASAAYTITGEPLFQFTDAGRILIDFSIAVFILFIVALIRWRNLNNKDFSPHKWQNTFIKLAVICVLVGGVLMIVFLRIIWLDFILVIAVLLLHDSVEKWIVIIWTYLVRRNPTKRPYSRSTGLIL